MSDSPRHTNMFSFPYLIDSASLLDEDIIETLRNTSLEKGELQKDLEQAEAEDAKIKNRPKPLGYFDNNKVLIDGLPSSTRDVCMEDGEKCSNCYYYGAPCLNCSKYFNFTKPNAKMTWEEYKKEAGIDMNYENFCEENDEYNPNCEISSNQGEQIKQIKQDKMDKTDKMDSADEREEQEPPMDEDYYGNCIGPYNENFSRCFGPCCN